MKPFYIVFISILVVFTSCNQNGKEKKAFVPKSVGNINSLQIVTPNDLWRGDVGETIREYFAAPADGLPQDEPLYSMNQLPPETFEGFVRNNRIFLYVNIGDEEKVSLVTDEFAKPQTGAIIYAPTSERLSELIAEYSPKIIENFYKSEIRERQRRTSVSTRKIDSMKQKMGVSFKIPSAYRHAIDQDTFHWFRKDLKDGTTNVMVYQVPLNAISDSTAMKDILYVRDSIGSKLLPVEDDDLFITERAYSPFLFNTTIDGKQAYETRGTWEVTNAYMAGPFINYAVKDEKNSRWVILEGWTYAPAVRKRNLQFELESILLTTEIE